MSTKVPMFNLHTIDNLGSLEISCFLSLVLFGVSTIQAYRYYQCFRNDRLFLKTLAIAVLVLEVVHSCMIAYIVYHYTVILGGDSPVGPNSYPSITSVIPEALITALVQGFFAFRIYRLSRSLYISITCWSLSFLRLGGLLALIVEGIIDVPRVPNGVFATRFAGLITLVFIVGASVDVLIAASLCYYLKRLASGEQSKSTSELVDRLMIWIVQTGMITCATSIGIIIGFYVKPQCEIWFSIYMVTTKLYSNSFFASLNLRHGVQHRRVTEISASGLRFQDHLARLDLSTSGLPESCGATLSLVTVPKKSLAFYTTRQSFGGTVLEERQSLASP